MESELIKVIDLYLAAVAELFPRLASHLKVKLPIRNIDWAFVGGEQRGKTSCGINYFIHGYGVSMQYGETKVDFDLGDKGQIDGVDPWKLWNFLESNRIKTTYDTAKEIEYIVKKEVENGNLSYSGYMLYYLTEKVITKRST
jgi:hypothetical protein